MQVDYAALKQQMRDANIEVSAGPHFGVEEAVQYQRFVAGVAYASGVPYNPVSAAVGLAFPQELPPVLGSQVGSGVFVNGKPWAAGIGDDGYLIVGTGNPAVNFQIANGVGVQVGLSVRDRKDMSIPSGSASGYSLPASRDEQDWTFAFSFATSGEAVLADYDLHLILSLDSTGAPTPVLDFVYDADANTFTADGESITDSAVNDDGTAVQNIQSYGFTFIKEKLLPESMRDAATPYGLYVLTLTATHKETDAVTTLTIPVNITN